MSRLYRALRFVVSPIIRVMWPTKVVNKENFERVQGAVVICNHYAVPDTLIPAVRLYKKELHVLAKAEAFESKIGNRFLRNIGAIPVKRGEPDINAVKEVLTVLKADKKLAMYPEGTRNKAGTKEMGEFKQGAVRFAIKTQKPVLPMMYYRMHKLFRKNYLYIGEPIYLEEFYGLKGQEDFERATQLLYQKMVETREKCDAYVASLKAKKK